MSIAIAIVDIMAAARISINISIGFIWF